MRLVERLSSRIVSSLGIMVLSVRTIGPRQDILLRKTKILANQKYYIESHNSIIIN